jgi:hypothetical protein
MKAICTKRMIAHTINGVTLIEEGDVVKYTAKERKFILPDLGTEMVPVIFFSHFKVIEGKDRMTYSDFEYILCNYVFGSAVLYGEEYNGIRHLVIQDMFKGIIMIAVNKNEDVIRVSFDDMQEKYSSYEEALEGIKNHRWGGEGK